MPRKKPLTFCISIYAVTDHGATPTYLGTTTCQSMCREGVEDWALTFWTDELEASGAHPMYLVTEIKDATHHP